MGTLRSFTDMIDSTAHVLTTEMCNLSPFRGMMEDANTENVSTVKV